MSNNEKPLVFINQPIKEKKDDVLGSYYDAEVINAAIEKGAEMIAVTSSFGSGKSTVTDLIKEIRANNKDEIVKVSMWSQLYSSTEAKMTGDRTREANVKEMHKNFLYQVVSQMNRKRGTYVIKKLSSNYDVLSIRTNGRIPLWVFVMATILLVSLYNINLLSSVFESAIILLAIRIILCFLLVVIAFFMIYNGEILFSFHNTKRVHEISIDELIDIYKEEVLGAKCADKNKKIIIIIEDLDRTKDGDAVKEFLIQLRRYYIDSKSSDILASDSHRRVSFIVNINKESAIIKKSKEEEQDNLFEKIFDYVYDLNEINTIDYEHVLRRLLEEKEVNDELKKLGLQEEANPLDIVGMRWISRGEKLNIRLLKDRLNRCFSRYFVLTNRGNNSAEISFEKCAVAAYLNTTYEKSICEMDDHFIEDLLDLKIEKGLEKEQVQNIKANNENLESSFIEELVVLINDGIIEEDYRQYLFNYPEKAKMQTREELMVQRALLYKTKTDEQELNESIKVVANRNPEVIIDAISKIEEYKQTIPITVLKNEDLFTITITES